MEAGALEVPEHNELCETNGVGGGRESRKEGVREREKTIMGRYVCVWGGSLQILHHFIIETSIVDFVSCERF